MTVILNRQEVAELGRQHPSTRSNGGWQSLMVALQLKIDRLTCQIELSDSDVERIARYAFDYGRGGWEKRLQRIVGRTLGPNLGRLPFRPAA